METKSLSLEETARISEIDKELQAIADRKVQLEAKKGEIRHGFKKLARVEYNHKAAVVWDVSGYFLVIKLITKAGRMSEGTKSVYTRDQLWPWPPDKPWPGKPGKPGKDL